MSVTKEYLESLDNNVPSHLDNLLRLAFDGEMDDKRAQLYNIAKIMYALCFNTYLMHRTPEDNRVEHELFVLANALGIAQKCNVNFSERKIIIAVSIFHDTCFIKRIMEDDIRKLKEEGRLEKAEQKTKEKEDQRTYHMKIGSENTKKALNALNKINPAGWIDFTENEIDKSVDIVNKHDSIKAGKLYPTKRDIIDVIFHEADILWPLHPMGVSADLERSGKSIHDPQNWLEQVKTNNKLFYDFKKKYDDEKINDGFIDNTYFRTEEGCRKYKLWLEFWKI